MNIDDAAVERALEAGRRRLAEQTIRTGTIVTVLVDGEEELWAARVVGQQHPPRGPTVDVFLGGQLPTFYLTRPSAHAAYREHHNLEVTVGAASYRLAPLEPDAPELRPVL